MDAITRIKQLGMPRRNNELWTFFPVNKIPNVLSADGDCRVADAPRNDVIDAPRNDEQEALDFSKEEDFAALLPIAKAAPLMKKVFAAGETEMGIIKSRNDFAHSQFIIEKGAKVSLEILDNKVMHEICAERFDILVDEGAELEIFFANPANDLPLTFRHFDIKQAANSTVRFANVLQDSGIGRISARVELNGEGANFDYRSLYLHFECGVLMYGTSAVEELRDDFLETLEKCQEMKLEDFSPGIPGRLLQAILRLFSPLM